MANSTFFFLPEDRQWNLVRHVFRGNAGEALAELDVWTGADLTVGVTGAEALTLRGREDVWLVDLDWEDVGTTWPTVPLALARLMVIRVAVSVDIESGRLLQLVPTRARIVGYAQWEQAPALIDDAL